MRRDTKTNGEARDPESRRASARGKGAAAPPGRQRGFVERAMAKGHSGRGSESVRPYLRDQLKLKSLLPQPFPIPEEGASAKDEPHKHE